MATARLFESLADETPPTTGEEIGAALAPALAEIAKSGERQAEAIGQAIAQAMREALAKLQATPDAHRQITEWIFDIEENDKGNMRRVVARASFNDAH